MSHRLRSAYIIPLKYVGKAMLVLQVCLIQMKLKTHTRKPEIYDAVVATFKYVY